MPISCADTAFSASRDRFEQVCSFLGDQEAAAPPIARLITQRSRIRRSGRPVPVPVPAPATADGAIDSQVFDNVPHDDVRELRRLAM